MSRFFSVDIKPEMIEPGKTITLVQSKIMPDEWWYGRIMSEMEVKQNQPDENGWYWVAPLGNNLLVSGLTTVSRPHKLMYENCGIITEPALERWGSILSNLFTNPYTDVKWLQSRIESLGFEMPENYDHKAQYVKFHSKYNGGKQVISINRCYPDTSGQHCACAIYEDAGTRTVFNGKINSIEDLKKILSLVIY